jgi:hypothetical protein
VHQHWRPWTNCRCELRRTRAGVLRSVGLQPTATQAQPHRIQWVAPAIAKCVASLRTSSVVRPTGRMGYHLSVFEEAIGVWSCCTRASQGEQRRFAARISSAEGTTSSCEESSAQAGTRLPAEVMSSSSITSDTYGPDLMRAVLPIFSASAAPVESRHPVEQRHASIQRVWDSNRPPQRFGAPPNLVRNQSNRGPLRQVSSARSLAPQTAGSRSSGEYLRPRSWFPLPTRSILSQNEPPEL